MNYNLRLVAVRKCFAHGLQLSLGLLVECFKPLRFEALFASSGDTSREVLIQSAMIDSEVPQHKREEILMYLLTNGRVITRDPNGKGYYEKGAVAFEGTKIVEVGN